VIVRDFNFVSSVFLPDETDAVLIIDPDAMLAGSIVGQAFRAVSRRNPQVVQVFGSFQHVQFANSNFCDCGPSSALSLYDQIFRRGIPDALDHIPSVTRYVIRGTVLPKGTLLATPTDDWRRVS
jgi:hypothetical protein